MKFCRHYPPESLPFFNATASSSHHKFELTHPTNDGICRRTRRTLCVYVNSTFLVCVTSWWLESGRVPQAEH